MIPKKIFKIILAQIKNRFEFNVGEGGGGIYLYHFSSYEKSFIFYVGEGGDNIFYSLTHTRNYMFSFLDCTKINETFEN